MSPTRTLQTLTSFGLALVLAAVPAMGKSNQGTSKSHPSAKSGKKSTVKKTSSKSKKQPKGSWRTRGQQNIDTNRSREIQAALIRAHYLDGTATGVWDARSKAAMQKFQADNGWQTKKIPDSRALIKLGLGPDHSDLINPATASVGTPDVVKGGGIPGNPQR